MLDLTHLTREGLTFAASSIPEQGRSEHIALVVTGQLARTRELLSVRVGVVTLGCRPQYAHVAFLTLPDSDSEILGLTRLQGHILPSAAESELMFTHQQTDGALLVLVTVGNRDGVLGTTWGRFAVRHLGTRAACGEYEKDGSQYGNCDQALPAWSLHDSLHSATGVCPFGITK